MPDPVERLVEELRMAMPMVLVRLWRKARFRLGCWLLGDGYRGAVMRLWLIRERAMQAITPDGEVVLAKCQPLSDALYAPIPGRWSFTISHVDDEPPASLTESNDNGN